VQKVIFLTLNLAIILVFQVLFDFHCVFFFFI
jgi:hypothetical protein